MNRMTPDLARLLVAERLDEAERRRRRRSAAETSASGARVPRQRRANGLLSRIVPRSGVRVPTR